MSHVKHAMFEKGVCKGLAKVREFLLSNSLYECDRLLREFGRLAYDAYVAHQAAPILTCSWLELAACNAAFVQGYVERFVEAPPTPHSSPRIEVIAANVVSTLCNYFHIEQHIHLQ